MQVSVGLDPVLLQLIDLGLDKVHRANGADECTGPITDLNPDATVV
jgi:hypothetical protein